MTDEVPVPQDVLIEAMKCLLAGSLLAHDVDRPVTGRALDDARLGLVRAFQRHRGELRSDAPTEQE